jgi:hypothetical protein
MVTFGEHVTVSASRSRTRHHRGEKMPETSKRGRQQEPVQGNKEGIFLPVTFSTQQYDETHIKQANAVLGKTLNIRHELQMRPFLKQATF